MADGKSPEIPVPTPTSSKASKEASESPISRRRFGQIFSGAAAALGWRLVNPSHAEAQLQEKNPLPPKKEEPVIPAVVHSLVEGGNSPASNSAVKPEVKSTEEQ